MDKPSQVQETTEVVLSRENPSQASAKAGAPSLVPRTRAAMGTLMQSEARSIEATFAKLAADGVDAGHIAARAVATWRDVAGVLAPIIGQRGVSALYKRSLHIMVAQYPWLTEAHEEVTLSEFASLRGALSRQSNAEAAVGSSAMLTTFYELLSNLIGKALTERLLRPVWTNSAERKSARNDTS